VASSGYPDSAQSDADRAGEASGYASFSDTFAGLGEDAEPAPVSGDLSRRLLSVLMGLLRIHLEIAQREASRDRQRLFRGLAYLVVAGFMGLLSLLIAEGLALSGLLLRLRLPWALAVLLGGNLLVAMGLVLLARRALAGPILPETRALLRRTLGSLLPK